MSNVAPPITAQISSNAPIPTGLYSVTAPLLPDQGVLSNMSNFPPETYNMNFGASIVKLMGTLTGPAGGGQFRQRQLLNRLRGSVSSTYFTDLDNSLGAALGISRLLVESLPFNPYSTAAPSVGSNSWVAMAQADATYRDRLFQVLRAVATYGPSPIGLRLIAESFLLCPCELTEGYRVNTIADITTTPTLAYYITIIPHIASTPQQQYGLLKILNKIKPANTVITIGATPGTSPYTQVDLAGAYATSSYWEIDATSSSPSIYGSTAVPQFAFGSSQAMAWTVNGTVSGVLSYLLNIDGTVYSPTDYEQITWADRTITNFVPLYAMTPASESVLGNLAAPGNSSANPFNSDITATSDLLLGGAPLTAVQIASTITAQTSPQFWSTPVRAYTDMSADVIEVRFSGPVNVNAISFSLANFPHTAYLQVYDDNSSTWIAFYSQTIATSVPAILPNSAQALAAKTHPQHFGPNCWVPVAVRFDPVTFSRARLVLVRPGPSGPTGPISSLTNLPAAYSLGVTEFSFDFIVDSAAELSLDVKGNPIDGSTVGTSTDVAGNTITYSVYSEPPTIPSSGMDEGVLVPQWRCFPQPVNNTVVNLYLDARNGEGNAQTIDRLFITPTHLGVACTLYFSIQAPTGLEVIYGGSSDSSFIPTLYGGGSSSSFADVVYGGTSASLVQPIVAADMASLNWILVNRQYQLMTGWMVFPPTAAKFWKLEMTNLVAEMLTNPFPVTADVLTFGSNAIAPIMPATGYQGALPPGAATQASLAAGETVLSVPTANPALAPGSYASTEALVATDPSLAQLLQQSFANYGYMNWQPFGASPVTIGGIEDYITTTIASINQVGFFTGFSSITAYRTNPACPIDTPLYYELFYDAMQIDSANCVTEGGIYSGTGSPITILGTPAVVVSNAYVSASEVTKVQFATSQSPPYEMVPFDTFHNGRYLPPPSGTYNWDDQNDWNIVGMGDVQVNFNAQTLTPTLIRGATLISPSGHNNGIVSAPFQTSPKGYVTFAVRLNIVSVPAAALNFFTTYPIYLQLCLWNGGSAAPTVLQEWALSAATPGQTVEEYFSYLVGSATGAGEFLCLAIAQHSGAACPSDQTASWTVQAASAFDPSIVWSFSSDGSTWVDAISVNPVRNNRNGITTLASPSTDLYWKCTIYRPDMYVTSLKLRPWYQGSDLPRLAPVAQGPNMTFSDPDQTIWTDPSFNTWALPVPIWWFARYAQLSFFPDGVPTIFPTSNHYVMSATESIGTVTDTASLVFEGVVGSAKLLVNFIGGGTVIPFVSGAGGLVATFTGSDTADLHYSETFDYTGGITYWTVPTGVTSITMALTGAAGGNTNGPADDSSSSSVGGLGEVVTFTVDVVPGHVLAIYVGQQPPAPTGPAAQAGGWGYGIGGTAGPGGGPLLDNLSGSASFPGGGAGGGATAIVDTTTSTLLAVAAAGGGAAWINSAEYGFTVAPGGNAGSTTGAPGVFTPSVLSGYASPLPGGGTQSAGGVGGALSDPGSAPYNSGPGGPGTGPGNGNGGSCASGAYFAGGGGAGYFGGGAGATASYGGTPVNYTMSGAGGSSWVTPSATGVVYSLAGSPMDGSVNFSYYGPA